MAKDMFRRYIWLIDTIHRAGQISMEEINEKWIRSSIGDGNRIPLKTFHNHRKAIEEIFDINIVCRRPGGYLYSIENSEELEDNGVRTWLLNTLTVNNLLTDCRKLRKRIVFENIPSGEKYLSTVLEAMRDGHTLSVTHRSFWKTSENTTELEPYFVKIFRQRWYMIARQVSDGHVRTYGLDRIIDMKPTENTYEFPEDMDPDAYFRDCFGVIKDSGVPAETVDLKVLQSKREYFRTLPLHHSQTEIETTDKYSVFRYFISPTYDFVAEILSHGYEVEVLAPSHLRGHVRWQAETIASR